MSGKGSKQRKSQVTSKQFEDNWNKIFSEKVSKVAIKDLLHMDVEKAADTQKQ